MERLTMEYCGEYVPRELCSMDRLGGADDCELCCEYCKATEEGNVDCGECAINRCFNKLGEYENLEEQGRLTKLPCAVGDTYFEIETAFCREEQECRGCRYYHTGSDVFRDDSCCLFEEEKWPSCAEIVEKRFESVKEIISYMEDDLVGKTVFSTHEEAEAALKELRSASKEK